MRSTRILVRGHVQGVGFRYFVLRLAHELGIDGSVWNRFDGAVELIAAHPDDQILDKFIERLHQGPGHVREVAVNDHLGAVQSGFTIEDSK